METIRRLGVSREHIRVILIFILPLLILKFVPLRPVTDSFGIQRFIVPPQESATVTLNFNQGWSVHGSYGEDAGHNLEFTLFKPDGKTIIFTKTNSPVGWFSFTSDLSGIYQVVISNPAQESIGPTARVTLDVSQEGWITII